MLGFYFNNSTAMTLFPLVKVKHLQTLNLAQCAGNLDRLRPRGELLEQLAVQENVNPVVEVRVAFNGNHLI